MKTKKSAHPHAKRFKNHAMGGFTLVELIVVIIVVFVLASMIVPSPNPRSKGKRIRCVNNLKQIGVEFRVWSNDHGGLYPSSASITNGGLAEILSSGNAGPNCWKCFTFTSNNPALLACPSDERKPAADFKSFTNNNCLSYFVGASASDSYPQSIFGGDRNLGPGIVPKKDYGFSPANGQGNDVMIKGPVCWSLKMHSEGSTAGAGNILLGDGSVQQVTSASFSKNWLPPATGSATNSPGVRLIFP